MRINATCRGCGQEFSYEYDDNTVARGTRKTCPECAKQDTKYQRERAARIRSEKRAITDTTILIVVDFIARRRMTPQQVAKELDRSVDEVETIIATLHSTGQWAPILARISGGTELRIIADGTVCFLR